MTQYDVVVIGGGIVGLAHAWTAARRKLRVVLIERSDAAEGASVRNFGMIWPIGQPAGELHDVSLRSRAAWLELRDRGVAAVETCSSIHLAHRADELAVQEEFAAAGTHGVEMLTAAEVLERSHETNPENLLGGMFSGTELRVDPRTASARIGAWLTETFGVERHYGTPVVGVDGRTWTAERIVVCSGSDLRTLFPNHFRNCGLVLCKLQMLRVEGLAAGRRSAPHLAGGLTLRHYVSFRGCASLPMLRERIQAETPELDRFGIHVRASPYDNGDIVLGDSHEYGNDIAPFDRADIDDLILRECRKIFRFDDRRIADRWHGIYAKHPQLPVYEAEPMPGVQIFVGTGGAGMTMAFGLAQRAWERWTGEPQ